uniref:MFS transporter protein n=1 Tax=Glyptapanteles flavicoxis TaxID=463051 RepID=B7S8D4_9HYME|nr:MFS transporter protein [Glyptapanteles flavicoxis]
MGHPAERGINQRDPIQDAMGRLGIWQLVITVALSIVDMPAAWHELAIPVIAPGQDFTCISPAPMNSSDSMLKACYVKVNESLPEVKCEKFSYDTTDFKSTIMSEWDLVCDRKFLMSMVQPLTQLGILSGNLISGIVADKIGRKTPLMFALLIQALAGLATSFMPTFELFLIFKLISAVATGGTMLIGFSIVVEIISVHYRSSVLILYQISFALGFLMVPGFSYLTRTWDGYWRMIALPSFFLLSYYWLIPESPRWLLAHGRVEEARQVLLKAAKWNKISPETVNAALESHQKLLAKAPESIEIETKGRSYGITDLLRTPTMRMRTLFIAFNWFKDGMVFFGSEYYLGRMSDSVLTNLAISALSQFPALVLAYFLTPRVSRLKVMAYSNVVAGISMLLIIPFYNNDMAKLIVVSIGSTGLTLSFLTGNLYTGELFPTVVRNIGYAICNVSSKSGSMISPFLIDYVNEIAYWVVPLCFGIVPIVGAGLCYWLPETMDCKLPETIEDGENFKRFVLKQAVDFFH